MSSAVPAVRKLSRGKRLIFICLALILAWLLTEGVSWVMLSFVEDLYQYKTRELQDEIVRGGDGTKSDAEVIHPYLGWVMNPQVSSPSKLFDRSIPVNSLGFIDEEHGIPKRRPDRVVVAISGGSVAWQVSVAGEKLLREELERSPQFRGKQLQLVRLAMSGHKQPQQLMALNYLLALGAQFDVLVNIDGYNEVALTVAENDESGVFAAYPRMWHARMLDVVDPRKSSVSFQLLQARGVKQQLAINRTQSRLSWSPVLNLIWFVRTKSLDAQMVELSTELNQKKLNHDFGFASTGPAQIYHGEASLQAHVVELWSNSSKQMQRLCQGNGITYLHVLQPNQYVPNSKPLTDDERKKMVDSKQGYGTAVTAIYPLLIKHGPILRHDGVNFHDLTMLFHEVKETVYADRFCHYNQRGNDLLAKALADLIKQALEPATR